MPMGIDVNLQERNNIPNKHQDLFGMFVPVFFQSKNSEIIQEKIRWWIQPRRTY